MTEVERNGHTSLDIFILQQAHNQLLTTPAESCAQTMVVASSNPIALGISSSEAGPL